MEFGLFCGGFVPPGLWGHEDPSVAEHERLVGAGTGGRPKS